MSFLRAGRGSGARKFLGLVAIGMLAWTAAVSAQTGGLAVLVVDEQSRPIEGAVGQVNVLTATTNAEGMMYFAGLPPGRHQLTTRFIGYQQDVRTVTILGIEATRIIVKLDRAPLRLPTVEVEATRPGLYGVVSSTQLMPIPNAEVLLVGRRGRTVRTDSAGRFMFPEAVGPYLIQVGADGYRDRQFSVRVPDGGGREVLVQLEAAGLGYAPSRNRQRALLFDLRFRLAWSRPFDVIARDVLEQYGTRSVCDVPHVAAVLNTSNPLGIHMFIDGHERVPNLCGLRADEIGLVESGQDACANMAMSFDALMQSLCTRMPEASGRVGQVRTRIRRGPAYLIVWLSR